MLRNAVLLNMFFLSRGFRILIGVLVLELKKFKIISAKIIHNRINLWRGGVKLQRLEVRVVDEGQIIFIKALPLFLHFNYIFRNDFNRISRKFDPFSLSKSLHKLAAWPCFYLDGFRQFFIVPFN